MIGLLQIDFDNYFSSILQLLCPSFAEEGFTSTEPSFDGNDLLRIDGLYEVGESITDLPVPKPVTIPTAAHNCFQCITPKILRLNYQRTQKVTWLNPFRV